MKLVRTSERRVINVDRICDILIGGKADAPLVLLTMACPQLEHDEDAEDATAGLAILGTGHRVVGLEDDEARRFLRWLGANCEDATEK